MLKTNELRIGNLVRINNPIHRKKDTDKTFHILKIDSENDSCNGVCIDDMPYAECFGQFLKYIEPIPLTEEWLIKFGFDEIKPLENDEHKWSTYSKNGVHIDLPYFEFNIEEISKEIKYVHQLQNLYFALTGVELELSSNVA